MTERRRARSVQEYLGKLQGIITDDAVAYASKYTPRADDILVSTYAKAGTTWMQQIVHGLRTGGDMDFREVTDVVPWIETAYYVGWDLMGEQKAPPRAYKTHHPYETVPKGAKYIWVVRDPKDSAFSFYNFMNGWFLEPGCISPDEFVRDFYLHDYLFEGYWSHLVGWWSVKDQSNILPLAFEHMKKDLAGTVRRVADFIEIDDESAINIATKQADFAFMKARESQFDDHPIAEARNEGFGLPADARSSKVKTGNIGGHKAVLSAETIDMLDAKWKETVEPALGFADYNTLLKAI